MHCSLLYENKDSTKKVCGYSLRIQDLCGDFISKIEDITKVIKKQGLEISNLRLESLGCSGVQMYSAPWAGPDPGM